MLKLTSIRKDYQTGDTVVKALRGVDVSFRRCEFVSILGPSGCGKTTLLNIIGGLDRYTAGDLTIRGRSTKDFTDRDWDAYRNHSIGFVFQSYNLIPHQTVLQNVELALTLSGVSKSERKQRAKKALEDVGLGEQLNKRPNELSGGQMQRVAIARALVNDPDIILADEPTGALDTETSVQVMEILKQISKDRLIVMVTHNPELAEKYSTRIIRMLDGLITDDSMPLTKEEKRAEEERCKKERETAGRIKLPSMSFGTSFMLSLKNLFTKKGRTTLTAFAGSIGIIGIALILAISQGTTVYINETQENALASYPLTIERTTVDLTSLMQTFMNVDNDEVSHEDDAVYPKAAIYNMINSLNNVEQQENDLTSFQAYLEKSLAAEGEESALSEAVSGVQYTYDLPLEVYTKNVDGEVIRSDSRELMTELVTEHMGVDVAGMTDSMNVLSGGAMSSMGSMSVSMWQEMLSGKDGSLISDVLKKQYDVVYGSWPNDYNEIVLVLDKNNELPDLTLYALGLESKEQIDAIMDSALNGGQVETADKNWSYEEICALSFHVVLNSSCYTYDELSGRYVDLRESDAGLRYLYDNGVELKVSGIIRPNEDSSSAMLTGGIGYTSALTEYVIEQSQDSDAIKAQMEDPSTDVISGLPFEENTGNLTDEVKQEAFLTYLDGLNEQEKAEAYVAIMSIPTDEALEASVSHAMAGMTRSDMEERLLTALTEQMSVDEKRLTDYVGSMTDEELTELFERMIAEQVKAQYAAQMQSQLAQIEAAQLSMLLDAAKADYTAAQCARYYDEIMTFSDSSYESSLLTLGYVELDDPATISIYASSFANKDVIEDAIADYNDGVEELSKIKYTDYIGIMMSSITTIINAITYVLIAFVAISLIVSSIMIGVITLISVQERTKEIGILRAIGASKRDVSSMFNAETVIIGFASGLLGVLITYLLCIPINLIIHALTDIPNLSAQLPLPAAAILVLISVLLTLISGLIPSKSAAKKDPVVALRTE